MSLNQARTTVYVLFGAFIFSDEIDYSIPTHTQNVRNMNMNEGPIQLKLLCGADLLESFAVPGLWKPEDVCCFLCCLSNSKIMYLDS